MTRFLVYVAGPYGDAAFVRVIHEKLRALDMVPTSRWAESAAGPEDFSVMTEASLRKTAAENDADLRGSDVCLVVSRAGAGGEMFAESRIALEWGKPLVWVGRRTLSAWRSGVVRVEGLSEGLAELAAMKKHHALGVRGLMLATVRALPESAA